MRTVNLPAVSYEGSLPAFLECICANPADGKICFDFAAVENYCPASITSLLARFNGLLREGYSVSVKNYTEFKAVGYFQRVNFFLNCGIELPETFTRHPSKDRFVPVQRVEGNINDLASEIADCMAPDLKDSWDEETTGFHQMISYSVAELGLNVQQHSKGNGFAECQFYPSSSLVRLAFSDSGIGIRGSFVQSGSPHAEQMKNDTDALKIALNPTVSSKTHLTLPWGEIQNAGVGLTFLQSLVKATGGAMTIISGNAIASLDGFSVLSKGIRFTGTVVLMTIPRLDVFNFGNVLYGIKKDFGLVGDRAEYEGLFT